MRTSRSLTGGFAGAFRTEQSHHWSGAHAEIKVTQGTDVCIIIIPVLQGWQQSRPSRLQVWSRVAGI
jgi:hypothetical protein